MHEQGGIVQSHHRQNRGQEQDVQLIGFGTFKAAKRAARIGKNPRTGEKLKIAAATVPRFSAGAAFKAAVNKKK